MKINFDSPDLRFYFSFQCPYSYILWGIMSKVLDKTKIKLAPINVGLTPTGTTKYHFRDIWSDERWERLSRDAEAIGIKISKPARIVSEISVSRALQYFPSEELPAYISSIFRAVFFAGIDISSRNKVRLHLQSESIDSSKFDDAQNDEKTKEKAEEHLLIWGHERLRIIPTIDNKGERYAGLIDSYGLERYIQDLLD